MGSVVGSQRVSGEVALWCGTTSGGRRGPSRTGRSGGGGSGGPRSEHWDRRRMGRRRRRKRRTEERRNMGEKGKREFLPESFIVGWLPESALYILPHL